MAIRSRGGCLRCRLRRRKCDEQLPKCGRCDFNDVNCDYGVRFRVDVSWDCHSRPKGKDVQSKFAQVSVECLSNAQKDGSSQIHKSIDGPIPFQGLADSISGNAQKRTNRGNQLCGAVDWGVSQLATMRLAHMYSGEEVALAYWFDKICAIMTACDGSRNPYRKFSSIVVNIPIVHLTIISHAGEWLYRDGLSSVEVTVRRHQAALLALQHAVSDSYQLEAATGANKSRNYQSTNLRQDRETLAATLMHITNTYFTGWAAVDMHLKAAFHLLEKLDFLRDTCEDFTSRFLLQRFALLDMWSSLIQNRRPYLPTGCWIVQPDPTLDVKEPSFREMTGCPQPIMCFLVRISHMIADLQEEDMSDVLQNAHQVETELRLYGAMAGICGRDEISVGSNYHTLAQCWYWCTHLILQRRIYADPPSARRVADTIFIIMSLIKSIPATSIICARVETPLCLLAMEVEDEASKQWIRQRNKEMGERYPSRTRDDVIALIGNGHGKVSD